MRDNKPDLSIANYGGSTGHDTPIAALVYTPNGLLLEFVAEHPSFPDH